jgi:hypothetical protein
MAKGQLRTPEEEKRMPLPARRWLKWVTKGLDGAIENVKAVGDPDKVLSIDEALAYAEGVEALTRLQKLLEARTKVPTVAV